jgi:NDP-sugar pyrophosphorylase family protein
MLPVGHRPILEYIVDWLAENGITELVISTGYLGRIIEEHFRDGSEFGIKVEYARSKKPLGIAGQLRNAESRLGKRFVCLYGDAILNFDLKALMRFHDEKEATLTMALMAHKIQGKYGVIELGRGGEIKEWKEKPVIESDINVGCYVMEKRYLDYIPARSTYGMKEAFESAMSKHERLFGLKVEGTFRDIGDRAAYREADEYYSNLYGKVP